VRETTRERVFLTFAAGDLALARPVTVRLTAGGGIALDHGFTSEPFEGVRGDIIRASLVARLRRCASALCLYGARTTDDDWVRWALETAAELRLPLLGVALPGADARESERYLSRLGAELLPLVRDDIVARSRSLGSRRARPAFDASSIAETLRLMRHPIR
jgi:hypothetical protein